MENLINTFFDKIYVINLSYSVERKKSMIEQFEKYKIKNYVFIEATDKNTLNFDELIEKKIVHSGNCPLDCTCGGKGNHVLGNGNIALSISHYRIYCDIIENGYDKCLILEDDCIFSDEMNNFNDIKNYIPEDWELLYLGNDKFISSNTTSNIGNSYFLKCFGVPCTHIYAITNNSAKLLSKNIFPIKSAIDGFLHRFIIERKILKNVYICNKSFAINGSVENLIKMDR
jgi:GR25 family glycosyltransferase involved in LPS biosynthesis